MNSRAQKTAKSFFVVLITALLIISALATITLVDMNINWSGVGLGKALTDSFARIGNAFNLSEWSKNIVSVTFVSALTILILGIGLMTLLYSVVLIIKKKFYLSFVYLPFVALYTLILAIFVVNLPPIYEVAISNGDPMNIAMYVIALILILVSGAVFVYFVLSNYYYGLSSIGDSSIQTIVLEETVVEESELIHGGSTTNITVVTNNYYGSEEKSDYVETGAAVVVDVPIEVIDNILSEVISVGSGFSGKKKPRPPFALKLRRAEDHVRDMYNEIKAEFLSYGINSRISLNGDAFRLHTKTYAIIQVIGKSLKINFALDCKDYIETTIPFTDSSKQKKYQEVPLTFKVRSNLSIKRAKNLIKDAVNKEGITQENEPVQKNYAREAIETLKSSQYYLKNFARK